MGERRRDAVDMLVARNIRILRQDRKMSQTELGRKIDVTFQQVQNSENGTNRVGSGRLFRIASILAVPITAFFEGAGQTASEDAGPSPVAMLAEPYVLRLLQAFCALEDMDLRRSLAELAEHMATDAFPARDAGEGESKSQRLRS
ncbi:MAG: helix-turn-helix domain-containing protein [Rhodoplanes sp.]